MWQLSTKTPTGAEAVRVHVPFVLASVREERRERGEKRARAKKERRADARRDRNETEDRARTFVSS